MNLTGQVLDASTRQPLAFATVFLANTTHGTATDSTGHFTLTGFPGGQYEVVVSFVGYELYKRTLDLQGPTVLPRVSLKPAAQLSEVVVRPGKNRRADYQKFIAQFIGTTTFSKQCRIENPEDVVVINDPGSGELVAVAPRNLRIVNQALGYRITYHQFNFKVNYHFNRLAFVGAPVFEELQSADVQQQQRWQENRRRAYLGSLPHFLRSVRENRLPEEGYVVQTLVSEPSSDAAKQRAALAGDSLAQVFSPEPSILVRVYKQPLMASQLRSEDAASGRVKLQFPASLRVTYQGEKPDNVYVMRMANARRNAVQEASSKQWSTAKSGTAVGSLPYQEVQEVSQLWLLGPEAVILSNGYLSNPLSLMVDGYWAFEKVGEALPLDYVPTSVN
ncbi:hypothetical protein PK28_05640 [Hymenobacter sp. DG25B]|nr:hypothetical protein PK28_05640 [Hymenobacter sp. DG25B]